MAELANGLIDGCLIDPARLCFHPGGFNLLPPFGLRSLEEPAPQRFALGSREIIDQLEDIVDRGFAHGKLAPECPLHPA
jgi:hypothetical protein